MFVISLLAGRVWLPRRGSLGWLVVEGCQSRRDHRHAAAPAASRPRPRSRRRLGIVGCRSAGSDPQPSRGARSVGGFSGRRARRRHCGLLRFRGAFRDRRAAAGLDRRTARQLFDLCVGPRRWNHNLGARRSCRFSARGRRNRPGPQSRAQPLRGVRNHDLADGVARGPQLEPCISGDTVHCDWVALCCCSPPAEWTP